MKHQEKPFFKQWVDYTLEQRNQEKALKTMISLSSTIRIRQSWQKWTQFRINHLKRELKMKIDYSDSVSETLKSQQLLVTLVSAVNPVFQSSLNSLDDLVHSP